MSPRAVPPGGVSEHLWPGRTWTPDTTSTVRPRCSKRTGGEQAARDPGCATLRGLVQALGRLCVVPLGKGRGRAVLGDTTRSGPLRKKEQTRTPGGTACTREEQLLHGHNTHRRSKNARQWHFIRAERSSNGSSRSIAHSRAHLCPVLRPFLFPPGSWRPSVFYLFYAVTDAGPAAIEFVSGKRACVHFSGCSAFYCMASLVFVPFKFVYWLLLKFASAWPLRRCRGEMAMAVASSARLAFLRGAVCASAPYNRHFPLFVPVQ